MMIDLRSDTVSKPSKAMRMAMAYAEVGDDVFEEDPTVKKLEETGANLLGKEAALFVLSGTMGNLISIMNHCDERGSEIYCGEESHVILDEQGSACYLAGAMVCSLPQNTDGTFDINKLISKLRDGDDLLHEPISKLVVIENTIHGKVIPQAWIEELAKVVKKHHLKLHMDGARLWNACAATGISAKEMVVNIDSVTFCLSKGLGAPAGSLLCGTKSFIQKARRTRKALGGGMRQVGILAAAGLIAIEQTVPLLKEDHRRARLLGEWINGLQSKMFTVDLQSVQTNMVFMKVNSNLISIKEFIGRLQCTETQDENDKIIVKAIQMKHSMIRFVFYYEITDEMLESTFRKIKYVIEIFDNSIK